MKTSRTPFDLADPESATTDPRRLLNFGIRWRRVLLALGLLIMFYVQEVLGKPRNPWFAITVGSYSVFMLSLELLARTIRPYHNNFWRAARLEVHIVFATILYLLTGSLGIAFLVYLPWMISAAFYFSLSYAFLFALEATILGFFAPLVFGGSFQSLLSSEFLLQSALLALGLIGTNLYTAYLWHEINATWRARVRQMKMLKEVGVAISAVRSLDETLAAIFNSTAKLIPFETGMILTWDQQNQALSPRAHRGYDSAFLREHIFAFQLGKGLTGYVAESRKPLLVPNVPQSSPVPPLYPDIATGKPLRSLVAVPLVFRNELLGVFELTSDRVNAFDKDQLEMLEWLARQIGVALHNAQLQEQVSQKLQEAEFQLRELTSLYNISLAMTDRGLDVEALLSEIVRQAAGLLNAHGGGLLLCYPEDRKVTMVFTHNLDLMKGFTFEFGQGIAGRVGETGTPMIVNDYQNWEGHEPQLTVEPYCSLIRAVLQVPLKWHDQVIGVLSVSDNTGSRKFEKKDQKLLERFANHAAVAIGNARTHSYLRLLVSNSPNAIIAVDKKGHITEYNEASEKILGYSRPEVQDLAVAHIYYDGIEEARLIDRMLRKAGERGISNYPTFVRSKSGEKIPIRLAGAMLHDEAGEHLGSIGIMTDLRREKSLLDDKRKGDFLAELEHYPQTQDEPILSLDDLRRRLVGQLQMVLRFCQSKYLVLFANVREDENVLSAIAWTGLPSAVQTELPHFNWRKAELLPAEGPREECLQIEAQAIATWREQERQRQMIAGIRGSNAHFFADAACLIPLRIADNYRSVLVFGPFQDSNTWQNEKNLLEDVSLTVGTGALSWLQALYLRSREQEAKTSAKLIIHRTRMNLLQINGKLGLVKRLNSPDSQSFQAAVEGENLVDHLSKSVSRALTSSVVDMEREDYHFQVYSLATLVQNCAHGFVKVTEERNRELRIDPSVERLPYARVDTTLLQIAVSNLIDNALKYSFEHTYILIKSEYDTKSARIIVDDYGEQLSEEARTNLSEPGLRWNATSRHIPGMGLGLWEAAVIARNHGGKLDFRSVSGPAYGRGGHNVRVWIELPLDDVYSR